MIPHSNRRHIQQALKMNGVFVQLTKEDFGKLINENEDLIIVVSKIGLFTTQYLHLTSYKGLVFYCKCKEPLPISSKNETIYSNSISLPTQF
jgi:hypothetical protein